MLRASLATVVILLAGVTEARAFILPYSTRTEGFSSWTPATHGDTNTIGMAGATVALPTSISSAESNPAGYAMTIGTVSAQINSTSYNDQRLQRSGDTIHSSQWGFAVSPEHWGLGIAYYSPEAESGTYVSPNTGDTVNSAVSLKEFRLTVARAFFDDRLSIGVALELAKAVRELDDASSDVFGPSYQLGVLYRLREHVLIAASFAPELTLGPSSHPDPQSVMPGFNQSVVRPSLFTFGGGWIPNRFFKVGLSVTLAGATQNTALLYDQTILTGQSATWVPRVGASYVVAEFSNFKIEAASGSYYEVSRISGLSDRLHVTAGLEINPSFINLGAGFDVASGFQNYIVSAGIDIVRTARTFDIIPKETVPAYHGFFPRFTHLSPDGLPSGLTADDPKRFEQQSVEQVSQIIENAPENIVKKASGIKTTVEVDEAKSAKDAADKKGRAALKGEPTPIPLPQPR